MAVQTPAIRLTYAITCDCCQVSVTMTLSAGAAEDIGGVIAAIADLLKIAVPPSYEIDQSETPSEYAKLALGGKRRWT